MTRVKPGALRLTGGTARGAKLFSVEGPDVRPALARMRTSVFEILRSRLDGARKKVIDNALRDFRLSGVALPPDKKERYKAIRRAEFGS